MWDNVWKYIVENNGAGGIVMATSKEEAEEKVKASYIKHGYGEDFNFSELVVQEVRADDNSYFTDNIDVLELYDLQ